MKKIWLVTALLLITPMAQANEIPGTRVAGQGAVCGEGQGKAVEVNATTKQEWSYCITIERPTPPTQQQLETKAQEEITKIITERKNQNAETVIAETVITTEPTVITETLTKVEVNATTGVVTVSALSEQEKAQLAQDRAISQARQKAEEQAQKLAAETQGTKQCIKWESQGQSGSECAFEPIPATEEEVTEQFDFFKGLLAFNWLNFLNLFADWRW